MNKKFSMQFMTLTVAGLLFFSCFALAGCGQEDSGSRKKKDKTSSTQDKDFAGQFFGDNGEETDMQPAVTPSENNSPAAEQSSEFGADSPEAAVNLFLDFRAEQQSQNIKKLAPAAYWEYIMSQWKIGPDAVIDYYNGKLRNIHAEDLAEDFGGKITVTFVVEEEKDITGESLKLMNELLSRQYTYSLPEITAAVCLYGKFQIETVDDTLEIAAEDSDYREFFYAVEISGQWYYVNAVLDSRYGEASFTIDNLVLAAS